MPGNDHPLPKLGLLERRLEELPVLPAVVSEVLSLDSDADDYFERVLSLAERDPPFAARVLRIANSPASAPGRPIVSLRHAVTRIGARQCTELVLAMTVLRVFVPRSAAQRSLWLHAIQTALASRWLCVHHAPLRSLAEPAYLCGLLHDIGRFVQFDSAPEDLSQVDDHHWASPRELVEVEVATLGYEHTELGFQACRKWGLPPLVADVVRHHHAEAAADDTVPHGLRDLLSAIQWADHLSVALIVDSGMGQQPAEELPARIEANHPSLAQRKIAVPVSVWSRWVGEIHRTSIEHVQQLGIAPD